MCTCTLIMGSGFYSVEGSLGLGMEMRMIALFALVSIGHAAIVAADIIEEKDTGASVLQNLSAKLLTDCGSNTVIAFLSDGGNGNPVDGATIFIFRTDSGYRILNRTLTNAEGKGVIGVPGKIQFLNDMYVLRIEKSGFRSKEIELTFWNCEDVVRERSEFSPSTAPKNEVLAEPPASPENEIWGSVAASEEVLTEATDAVATPQIHEASHEPEKRAEGFPPCLGLLALAGALSCMALLRL